MAAVDRILKLKSQDGVVLSVPLSVISKSVTITHLLDDVDDTNEEPIPIPNVQSIILEKVIAYLQAHKDDPPLTDEQQQERRAELPTGFDAAFVDIKQLLDLGCKAVALLIKGRNNAEVRALFGITTEFTKEEEEEVRRTNPWCDDKA
jgi:S-phase kinase-associated protein 1